MFKQNVNLKKIISFLLLWKSTMYVLQSNVSRDIMQVRRLIGKIIPLHSDILKSEWHIWCVRALRGQQFYKMKLGNLATANEDYSKTLFTQWNVYFQIIDVLLKVHFLNCTLTKSKCQAITPVFTSRELNMNNSIKQN